MTDQGQTAVRVRTKPGFLGSQAVTRIIEEVERQIDLDAANQLLSDARIDRIPAWNKPVPEGRVAALHQAIRRRHPEKAECICRNAGRATTDYLLGNRISVRAQELIKKAPQTVAMWLVTRSAMMNARHFGGSGEFIIQSSTVFELRSNPVLLGETSASPVCHYHAAAFERMYQLLVDPDLTCRETACEAMGDDACRFEISRTAAAT
jgi:divinyl protochlorophyllide a 8-vinyl-reductase